MLTYRRHCLGRESGQVAVFFALLIPMFLAMGSIVLDVGNFYIHQKRLQILVDAAAFAAGTEFTKCTTESAAVANDAIMNAALEYAGDTRRDPSTRNLQVQQPNNVHVVLNSSAYWAAGDAGVPGSNGYGHDLTSEVSPDASKPCSSRYLDVKATELDAPLLWGLLPLRPDPKAHARVEARRFIDSPPILPFVVPWVEARSVAAILINEETGEVIGRRWLEAEPAGASVNDLSYWRTAIVGDPTNPDLGPFEDSFGSGQFSLTGPGTGVGVIILYSENDQASTALPGLGEQPDTDCLQNPLRVVCYWARTVGGTNDFSKGLSFIHKYEGDPDSFDGAWNDPEIEHVQLVPISECGITAGNASAPYFNLIGECRVQVSAVIDFGDLVNAQNPTGNPMLDPADANQCFGDPPAPPPRPCGGIGAKVRMSSPGLGECDMQWNAGGLGNATGTWTLSATGNCNASGFSLPREPGGRYPFEITVLETKIKWPGFPGGEAKFGPFSPGGPEAGPYVGNGVSGPVHFLELTNAQIGGQVNSRADDLGPGIHVRVGLQPQLQADQKVLLRVAAPAGSKNQLLNCDGPGEDPESNVAIGNEILNGCMTNYLANYDKPLVDPSGTWRDEDCWDYEPGSPTYGSTSWRYKLPPGNPPFSGDPYDPNPKPDCVLLATGDRRVQLRTAYHNKWGVGTPACLTNNWPDPPRDDPRWISVIVTDASALEGDVGGPGAAVPIRAFASFYVTGWTLWDQTATDVACANEPAPPQTATSKNAADLWGYFLAPTDAGGGIGAEFCDFTGIEPCIAVLTQ